MQVGPRSLSAVVALLALGGCAHVGAEARAESDERLAWLADTLADSLEVLPAVPQGGPVGAHLARLEALLAQRHPVALQTVPGEILTSTVIPASASLAPSAGEPIALLPPSPRPTPPTAPAPTTGPLFQVELGRFESPELARLVWSELLAAAPLALGGLEPSTPTSAGGVILRAGPLPDAAAAADVCGRLAGLGVACTSQRLGGGV
jgi:hypothetical protein